MTAAALTLVDPLPVRAVAYLRISLDATGEAEGVERQEQSCRDLAAREGWDVVEVITDNDVSAFSGVARPGYDRLLTLIERGEVDAVVALHSDRLYRRPRDLERLVDVIQRNQVRVLTAMSGAVDLSTASGQMVAKMLAVVSEHESARIGERVSAKHRANAEHGKAHGGARPYGYQRHLIKNGYPEDKPGVLEVDPVEAERIREAAAAILRGASLSSIVVAWNNAGYPTTTGAKWRPGTLSKVLRAGRIAGLREVDGEVLRGVATTWPAILDEATWQRVRSRIVNAPIGRRPRRNLLAGFCYCGRCGVKMGMQSEAAEVPGGRRTIACDKANRHGCGSCSARAEYVEAIVEDYVLGELEKVNLVQARARLTVDSSTALVASIAADEQMMSDLAANLGARRIGRGEWLAAREPIEDRLAENRRALEQVAADSELDDAVFDGLDRERWEELDLDQKRAVIRLFVDRVVIDKGRPGRNFNPDRVNVVPT